MSDERRQPALVAAQGEPSVVLNAWCNDLAADAGLPGPFVAWVGYVNDAGSYRVLDALQTSRGWVRPDGTPVFDTLPPVDLPFALPAMTQLGTVPSASFDVATGMNGANIAGEHCAGFSSATATLAPGHLGYGGGRWSRDELRFPGPCMAATRFYCFGRGRSVAVRNDPTVVTRLAFVSARGVPFNSGPDAGVAAADAFCQTAAVQRGYTGTFKALVPSIALTAQERAAPPGPPWARADGTLVATPTQLGFVTGALLAPMENTAGLGPADFVLTGASGPAAPALRNCNDWTNNMAFSLEGMPFSTGRDWYEVVNSMPGCNPGKRLYCFEQ